MTENKSYNAENKQERERLRALVTRLSDQELALRLSNGWTVSDTLVHLAFWDLRQLAVLRQWIEKGVQPVPIDDRTTNEAVSILAKSIPPKAAASLWLGAAESVDGLLETIKPELEAEILRQGHERLLRRSLHRREHLAKIEEALIGK